ncbi:MAG: YbaK/EbsC family protein, partial [Mesorhizobium sp.]
MAGSIDRVTKAAADAGLDIEIRRMGASTRTAEEAAAQCGCTVAQ